MNMTRKGWFVPVLAAAAMCWGSTLAAQDNDKPEGNQTTLAKAVMGARVPLERGLAASASHGQAISAKFEMEEGKFQLSVYTLKDGKYLEVIVDHNSGKVVKAEPITESEDLTAAQSQSAAMASSRRSTSSTGRWRRRGWSSGGHLIPWGSAPCRLGLASARPSVPAPGASVK